MDSTSIDRIARFAIDAEKANKLDTHTPAIVLRDDAGRQRIESLEPFAGSRSRFRGTFSTSSLQDFARYVISRPGSDGFIQPDKLAAMVIFNLHVPSEPSSDAEAAAGADIASHADHRAVLELKATPAYSALQNAAKVRFGQKPLIEWLEDWWDYLAADYPDTINTDGNDSTRLRQALNALRKVKVKATGESVHTDKDFGASRSAFEDVEASSDVGLPRGFRFACQPSDDLDQRTFYLRLGVITSEKEPQFVLRWSKREADIEAIGQAFKAKLLDAVSDKATMLLGTFDPGK